MFASKSFSNARRRVKSAALLSLCALLAFIGSVGRAQTNIVEFPINGATFVAPEGIVYGPDNAYWFTEILRGGIGRIDLVSNTITTIPLTFRDSAPFGITVGPDANLWFTEGNANFIGRMTTSSNFVELHLLNTNTHPRTIITGPDNALWFVEYNLNRIAAFTAAPYTNGTTLPLIREVGPFGTNKFFGSPGTNAEIYGLTVGPDNNIWFTMGTYGVVGTFDTNATFTNLFSLPNSNSVPLMITKGSDGALWFTEFGADQIGRITTSGQLLEFPIPLTSLSTDPEPYGITPASDGSLWFTEYNGAAVGRITTNGVVTIFPTPTPASMPSLITAGPGGGADTNVWFGETNSPTLGNIPQKIGKVVLSEALDLFPDTSGIPASSGLVPGATNVSGTLATFSNSNATNTVAVNWADGTGTALEITNITPFSSVTTNVVMTTNGVTVTNSLSIINASAIDTNTGASGIYVIQYSHTYTSVSNYIITVTVTDGSNDVSTAHVILPPSAFFSNAIPTANQVEYLTFPDSVPFGYFTMAFYPYVFHFDLGFEYFIDANDGQNGAYLYDFTSQHFFYTNPAVFPYLYDFTLGAWLYYFPDPNRAGHYTKNPRSFYNFGTGQFITQ